MLVTAADPRAVDGHQAVGTCRERQNEAQDSNRPRLILGRQRCPGPVETVVTYRLKFWNVSRSANFSKTVTTNLATFKIQLQPQFVAITLYLFYSHCVSHQWLELQKI